jgi:Flp pilus assembly protein TadB
MATIHPKGEKVRQAVKWISSELQEDEKQSLQRLIQQAALRFNLSPMEEEFLVAFYKEKKGQLG